MRRLLLQWARCDDMWKRRAAILSQIRFKAETDADLLFACIEASLMEVGGGSGRDLRNNFFIRKAIGWALRQYARVAPAEVRRYVLAHRDRMSPLSVREALKHLPGPTG